MKERINSFRNILKEIFKRSHSSMFIQGGDFCEGPEVLENQGKPKDSDFDYIDMERRYLEGFRKQKAPEPPRSRIDKELY